MPKTSSFISHTYTLTSNGKVSTEFGPTTVPQSCRHCSWTAYAETLPATSTRPSLRAPQYSPWTTTSSFGLLPLPMLHTCPSTAYSTCNPPAQTYSYSKYLWSTSRTKERELYLTLSYMRVGSENSTASTSRQMHLKKGQKVGESMLPHKHVCFINCLNSKSLPFSRQTPLGHIFQLC